MHKCNLSSVFYRCTQWQTLALHRDANRCTTWVPFVIPLFTTRSKKPTHPTSPFILVLILIVWLILQHGGLLHIPLSAVPVSERSDHQSVRVAQILVAELKLGIADVHVAVPAFVIPAMPQLRQPRKGLTVCHLQGHKHLECQAANTQQSRACFSSYLLIYETGHHITSVHVNSADGHDFLPVPWGQISKQHVDEWVQLCDLADNKWVNLRLKIRRQLGKVWALKKNTSLPVFCCTPSEPFQILPPSFRRQCQRPSPTTPGCRSSRPEWGSYIFRTVFKEENDCTRVTINDQKLHVAGQVAWCSFI